MRQRIRMNKVVLLLVLVLSLVSIGWYLKPAPVSCDILYGTWRSDKDATLNDSKNTEDMKPELEEFLSQVLGNLTVTYEKDRIIEHETPEFPITVSGKTRDWGTEKTITPYELVSCGKASAKIRYNNVFGESETVKLAFVNEELFRSGSIFSAYREYFRRVSE